jgi:sortase (surface protein transpeptidase)
MTAAIEPIERSGPSRSLPSLRAWRRRGRAPVAAADLPPLSPRAHLARTMLVVLALVAGGLLVQVTMLSSLQQRSAQQQLFDSFRAQLAEGTAPIGPTDGQGGEVASGDPVAYLEIPAIGVRQVVVEGTASSDLVAGPGHRRDTPLPGQAGVSVVYGRQATFGGPFARIDELEEGDEIRVTTGQGEFTFEVLGTRLDGEPIPPAPAADEGRLLLATAEGTPFLPAGVVRVDADLGAEASPGPARPSGTLPDAEGLLASDPANLPLLAFWLQVLVVLAAGCVWAWHRWGRAQTWVVFLPPLLLVSTYVSTHTAELLPNLL